MCIFIKFVFQDLQVQLVEPSGLPLVEKLTLELQVLREKVEHHNATCINHKVSQERQHKYLSFYKTD